MGRKSGAKQARHDSGADLSPPRRPAVKPARHDSDADLSPPRKSGAKQARHDSDVDLSPPRRSSAKQARHDSDVDLSPPRQRRRKADEENNVEEEKMSSGLRSGLVSGTALKEEAAKVRAERKAALEALPDSQTGK